MMAKNFGRIFFRIWAAASIAWMLCGIALVVDQAIDRASEQERRLQRYAAALSWLDKQCVVMPEKLDRQEKSDSTSSLSVVTSAEVVDPAVLGLRSLLDQARQRRERERALDVNPFLSALDNEFEETGRWPAWKLQQARELLRDCQSNERTTKLHDHAVTRAGLERDWSALLEKEIRINFRPEPMGYIEALMLTDRFGEGVLVFLVAPLVVLYFGYTVRVFWISRLKSFIQGGWSAASRNTRLVTFWIVVWLVFYPLAVFFFQPSFLNSSENPERIFIGGWIFLPSIFGIVWVGYRKLFGRGTLNH